MPSEPGQTFKWMPLVVGGLQHNREAQFARVRRRLVVFTDRKEAAGRARKETNEFWRGKVQPVRLVLI